MNNTTLKTRFYEKIRNVNKHSIKIADINVSETILYTEQKQPVEICQLT